MLSVSNIYEKAGNTYIAVLFRIHSLPVFCLTVGKLA